MGFDGREQNLFSKSSDERFRTASTNINCMTVKFVIDFGCNSTVLEHHRGLTTTTSFSHEFPVMDAGFFEV